MIFPLEPLPSPEETAILKHGLRIWVQNPVVALARVPGLPRNLDETVVQTQIVSDAVLPRWELFPLVWEFVYDVVADSA